MKLIIKNKFFSVRGHSDVTDEDGNPRFRVRGKFFTMTNKKFVETLDGERLFTVKNKIFNFLFPACFIKDGNGEKIAKLKRRFRVFSSKFDLIGYRDDLAFEGDMISHQFVILRNGEQIGELRNKFITITDTFILDVYNDADAPFMVALVIAIDNIIDRMQNSHK